MYSHYEALHIAVYSFFVVMLSVDTQEGEKVPGQVTTCTRFGVVTLWPCLAWVTGLSDVIFMYTCLSYAMLACDMLFYHVLCV